jgi:hypothetical protein
MNKIRKIDLLFGFLLGLAVAGLGAALIILVFTHYGLADGFGILYAKGKLGKILALGALLDVGLFYLLLRKKREMMARGLILTFFFLAIFGLFI